MFELMRVTANIPLNDKTKIEAACKLLEKFKPDEPVTITMFTDHCVTVTAKYSWLKGLLFKNYVKTGKNFIDGFNVILED